MMLMRWDVSLDLKTSKDGAHFTILLTFKIFLLKLFFVLNSSLNSFL